MQFCAAEPTIVEMALWAESTQAYGGNVNARAQQIAKWADRLPPDDAYEYASRIRNHFEVCGDSLEDVAQATAVSDRVFKSRKRLGLTKTNVKRAQAVAAAVPNVADIDDFE